MKTSRLLAGLVVTVFLHVASTAGFAATVLITPSEDNTVSSGFVSNSNAEGNLFSGQTEHGGALRALMKFDIVDNIPAGATINSVTLELDLVKDSSVSGSATFALHALSDSWGQGTSDFDGGHGAAATTGDATWDDRFFSTSTWNTPGGDFASASSGTLSIGTALGDYTFASQSGMVSNVQSWLSSSATNDGWIMMVTTEGGATSAREFGSLTSTTKPTLTVTYSTTGASAISLSTTAITGLREMQGSSALPASITISNTGATAGTFTLTNTGANELTFGTSSGILAASGNTTSSLGWTSTTTTGSQSGIVTITGLIAGDTGSPKTATITGAIVRPRTVIASPISLGRFISGLVESGSSQLTTTGDDSNYTRVTVNGTLFNSAATTSTYGLVSTYAPGPVSGSGSLPVTGEGLAGEGSYAGVIVSFSGTAVQNRVVVASPTTLGLLHIGQSFVQAITLSTTGLDSQNTRVTVNNAGPDANGISVSGGTNTVFNAGTVTNERTLSGVFTSVGTVNGSITLPTTGEGLVGEMPINVPVNYMAQVYSGKAQWSASTSTGPWSTAANWTDTVGGGPSGPPGLLGYATDTATFGPNTFSGIVVVALNSAAPVLSNLVFNNQNTNYWILQTAANGLTLTSSDGNSPTAISVISGTHSVDASILLESNLVVSSSGNLTVSGNISDGGKVKSLTLDGGGELILSGSNNYTGGTMVNDGTLAATDRYSLPDGGSLTVGASATSLFGPAIAAPLASLSTAPVAPVPEPGTLALLAIVMAAFGCLGKWSNRL